MRQYFKNFTEELGEVRVKLCNEDDNIRFTKHGKLFKNPKTDTFMINYYGVLHKAKSTNMYGYIFSHKRKEYYAELEHDF